MNLRSLLCCAVLALTPLLQAEPWTLARALEVAQENSPDLLVARARLAGSEAGPGRLAAATLSLRPLHPDQQPDDGLRLHPQSAGL